MCVIESCVNVLWVKVRVFVYACLCVCVCGCVCVEDGVE